MIEEKPEQFFTSPASIGEYLSVIKNTAPQAESILCLTLSSRLSGLYNLAVMAVKQAREQKLAIPIEVLDTQNAVTGEGLVVTAACESAVQGKSLAQVLKKAEFVRDNVSVIGIMETIKNVYRTGRIPKLAARFGSMLNIHPVFTISGGSVHIVGITQNQKSGMSRIMRQIRTCSRDRLLHVAITHANVPEAGEQLKERIEQEFNCVEIWVTDFSPVMAYATGTGTLAVAYYTEPPKPSGSIIENRT
jgi:DegV family protein with EDD domain